MFKRKMRYKSHSNPLVVEASSPALAGLSIASASIGLLGALASHGMVLPILGIFLGIIISMRFKVFMLIQQAYKNHRLPVVLFMLLLLWMLGGSYWSLWPEAVIKNAFRTGGLLVAISLASYCWAHYRLDHKAFKIFEISFYVGGVSLLTLLYLEYYTFGIINHWLVSMKKHPYEIFEHFLNSGTSVLLMVLWPFLYQLVLKEKYRWALALWIAVVILSFQMNFHAARWAILFSTLTMLGSFYLGRRFSRALVISLIGLLVFSPLLVLGPFDPNFVTDLVPGFRSSGVHRLYTWQFINERIFEHPFLGWGLNTARYLPGAHLPTPVGGQFVSLHPHNGALQVWLELGAVGVLLIASLAIRILWPLASLEDKLWRSMSLATILVAATFMYVSFGASQSWWLGSIALGGILMIIFKIHQHYSIPLKASPHS